jgi:hypothetical protein
MLRNLCTRGRAIRITAPHSGLRGTGVITRFSLTVSVKRALMLYSLVQRRYLP